MNIFMNTTRQTGMEVSDVPEISVGGISQRKSPGGNDVGLWGFYNCREVYSVLNGITLFIQRVFRSRISQNLSSKVTQIVVFRDVLARNKKNETRFESFKSMKNMKKFKFWCAGPLNGIGIAL